MKIDQLKPPQLTSEVKRKLYSMSLRSDGVMWSNFQCCLNDPEATSIVLVAVENGKMIGWSHTFRYDNHNNPVTHVYVKKAHRRKGVGSKLIAKARKVLGAKLSKKLSGVGHTAVSRAFFRKNQVVDIW